VADDHDNGSLSPPIMKFNVNWGGEGFSPESRFPWVFRGFRGSPGPVEPAA
jgi:hypothetical protein